MRRGGDVLLAIGIEGDESIWRDNILDTVGANDLAEGRHPTCIKAGTFSGQTVGRIAFPVRGVAGKFRRGQGVEVSSAGHGELNRDGFFLTQASGVCPNREDEAAYSILESHRSGVRQWSSGKGVLPHREVEGNGNGAGKSSFGDARLQSQAGSSRADGDHAVVQGSYGAAVGDAEVVLLL